MLASLHPLAMIAASVVEPSELGVIVAKSESPHTFRLKPSDIERINRAKVVVWAGPYMEPYLAKLAESNTKTKWIDISKININSSINDPHRWLSTQAAIGLQRELAEYLGVQSTLFDKEIQRANQRITQQLAPYKNVPFFVFHKAYDYWVEERQLAQQMAFSQNVQQESGLRSILKIRSKLEAKQVMCVFSEAQFSKALINSVIGKLDVMTIEIDPMGYEFDLQKHAYRDYLLNLSDKFKRCLQASNQKDE